MPYTYVTSMAQGAGKNQRWVWIDAQNQTLYDLNEGYRKVLVEVSHPTLNENHILDVDMLLSTDFAELLLRHSLTIQEVLNAYDPETIPALETGTLTIDTKTVHASDPWLEGYTVQPTDMDAHPSNAPWPPRDQPDLLVTRPQTDYVEAHQYLLTSVNGLIHRTWPSSYGLYVEDGMNSSRIANENTMHLLNFEQVGPLTLLDIDENSTIDLKDSGVLHHETYIQLPEPRNGRYVGLVIGGYPHLLDRTYDLVSDDVVKIRWNQIPLIQRYYESKEKMDLSSIPYDLIGHNEQQRYVGDLLNSDRFIRAYLNLSQTFAFYVDAPHLFVENQPLERTRLAPTYYAHSRPRWPIRALRGQVIPYWAHQEEDVWVINALDSLKPNYQFEHGPYPSQNTVTDQKDPQRPRIEDRPFYWIIGRDQ